MPAQRLLEEIGGEIAATAALIQSMTLEFVHHATRQGDVDPLRTGRIGNVSSAWRRVVRIESLLQLLHQILKKRHDIVQIYIQYYNNIPRLRPASLSIHTHA